MFGFLLVHAIEWAKVGVEVGLMAVLIYLALQFVRETRAVAILAGIIILALGLSILSRAFDLEVIGWLVSRMWAVLAFTTVIVFQPEVRRALSEIGRRRGFLHAQGNEARGVDLVNTLVDATYFLADRRIGALIAIEQSIGLRSYAETGTPIDAAVSSKLLASVFFPNTPLHDGGVIIRRDQLVAAGCIFPLSQSPELGKTLGTRHRAGVGLCEETDAVVIVVSEESGAVSLARSGRLTRGVARDRLKRHLTNYLVKKPAARRAATSFRLMPSRAAADTPAAGEA